jgi:hypothetical protein
MNGQLHINQNISKEGCWSEGVQADSERCPKHLNQRPHLENM